MSDLLTKLLWFKDDYFIEQVRTCNDDLWKRHEHWMNQANRDGTVLRKFCDGLNLTSYQQPTLK